MPTETAPGEARVALVPSVLRRLADAGMDVVVEHGAGARAGFPDESYAAHGARIGTRADVFGASIVAQVRSSWMDPENGRDDIDRLHRDHVAVGMSDPLGSPEGVRLVADRGITSFSLDLMPRITRAQSMDVLSSQATVIGYKAVLLAANRLPKMFPMLTTAAGTVPPAQVLVIGAGVAGLTAIATARRMGAVVQGYDVRPSAQEDIESLGARCVLLPLQPGAADDPSGYAKEFGTAFYRRQQELIAQVVAGVDVVITTALIPGKKAPVLITEEAVLGMPAGSVIVDCAAERGGNCDLTDPDNEVIAGNSVTILGPTNLASTVPHEASLMYAKNMVAFLLHIVREGALALDLEDEIIAGTLVTRDGEVVNPRVLGSLEVGRVPGA